jgi:hypothetical protein
MIRPSLLMPDSDTCRKVLTLFLTNKLQPALADSAFSPSDPCLPAWRDLKPASTPANGPGVTAREESRDEPIFMLSAFSQWVAQGVAAETLFDGE